MKKARNHSIPILITRGCGFIGSNFIPHFLQKYPNYLIINLDKLINAGNRENLKDMVDNPRYTFIRGDICNRTLIEWIFHEFDIREIIHSAAESPLDNSIEKPDFFIKTNIEGRFTLLDVARNYWMESPKKYNREHQGCRFHYNYTLKRGVQ